MKAKPVLGTSILALLCAGATASALTMDTVTIGNPGNPHDPLTGGLYGGVSETYAIGKYEVAVVDEGDIDLLDPLNIVSLKSLLGHK